MTDRSGLYPTIELNPVIGRLPCLYDPGRLVAECDHFLCADWMIRRSEAEKNLPRRGLVVSTEKPATDCAEPQSLGVLRSTPL